MNRRIVLRGLWIVEFLAVGYVTVMVWLMSTWFLDDWTARTLSEWGWWKIGLGRVATAALAGSVCGAAVWVVNRVVRGWLGETERPVERYLPFAAGGIVLLGGVAGAVRFLIDRPFL